MSAEPQPSRALLFGPFTYDLHTGALTKFGVNVRLQGQPQQILSVLAERPGVVVTRDELQLLLWNGTTFVDFDRGLNAAVNKLRQTLGDSADQPRYIETVPGKGYRFIAPIRASAPRPVIEKALPAAEPVPKRYRLVGVVLGIVTVAGFVSLGLRSRMAPPVGPAVRFTVTPPAGYELEGAASRQAFAVSPDGSRVAFTAMDNSGAHHVFVRELDQVAARVLPDSAGAHTVFWAPDSKQLFYTAKGELFRQPLDAEARHAVATSPAFLFMGAVRGASSLILSSRTESFTVSTHGGTPESLGAEYWWAQALPDGRNILYVRFDEKARRYHVRVADPADPASGRTVAESDSRAIFTRSVRNPEAGYLLYVRRGVLMAHPFDPARLVTTAEPIPIGKDVYSFFVTGAADISASEAGVLAYQQVRPRSQLVWVDRKGRVLQRLGPEAALVKSGRISPDGTKVAAAYYDVERGSQNLWIFDTDSGARRLLEASAGLRDSPVWQPDSARLTYMQGVISPPRVAVRGLAVDDKEAVLAAEDSYQAPTSWSPEGRYVAFVNTGFARFPNDVNSDLFVSDGAKPVALTKSRFHEGHPTFSPDGRWMAFTSNESGNTKVYVQAFQGGDNPRLTGPRYAASGEGVQALRWPGDGREIFYLGFDGKVRSVSAKLGAIPTFGRPEALFEISLEARAAIHSITGFDVSADGQRFLIPVITGGDRPSLVVVQNWEASLKN